MILNDKLILNDQPGHSLGYLGSIWYHSELSEVTYSTNNKPALVIEKNVRKFKAEAKELTKNL